MPQQQTIPMIGPNGEIGDVPVSGVAQAAKDGFKIGKEVTDNTGKKGVIPFEKFGEFMRDNPRPADKYDQPVPSGFQNFRTAVDQISNVTPQQTQGHGAIANALQQFGASGYGAVMAPFVHPIDTAVGLAKSIPQMVAPAIGVPGQINDLRERLNTQPVSQALAGILGENAGNAVLAEGIGSLVPFKGAPRPVEPETAARNITGKAMMTSPGQFENNVDALLRENGNVQDYAQKTAMPTQNFLQTSKAAGASAQSLGDFYRNELLGRAGQSGQTVSVPPSSDVGSLSPGGSRYATLEQIDARVKYLNDLLRPSEGKATELETQTDKARKAEINAEKNQLTDILRNEIASRLNLRPEAVEGVMQSMGARAQLRDQMLNASNTALTATGRVEQGTQGTSIPTSAKSAVTTALDKVVAHFTGGPEGQLTRSFQKYYPTLDVPPNVGNPVTLEDLNATVIAPPPRPVGTRQPPLTGASTPVQTFDATPNTDLAAQREAARTNMLNQRAEAARLNRIAANREFLHAHNLEQGAQDAAAGRSQAVDTYRDVQVGEQRYQAQRDFLHANDLEQAAQDAAQGRGSLADALRVANANKTLQQAIDARKASIDQGARLRQKGYENRR